MGTRVTTLEEAIAVVKKHRDQQGDDRCWLDDKELYAAFGLEPAETGLPPKEEFLGNCARYHACRQNPADKYVTVEEKIEQAMIEADRDWLNALESPFEDEWNKNVRESCKKIVRIHYSQMRKNILLDALQSMATLDYPAFKKWMNDKIRQAEEFIGDESAPSAAERAQKILLKLTDEEKKTNDGQFVAVDLDSEKVYFSSSDYGALKAAKAKNDKARIYLSRIGQANWYRFH